MAITFNATESVIIGEWIATLKDFPESSFIILTEQSDITDAGFDNAEDLVKASETFESYINFIIATVMDDNDTANIYLIPKNLI